MNEPMTISSPSVFEYLVIDFAFQQSSSDRNR